MKGTRIIGKILERIENAIKIDEAATFLFSNAIEAISNSIVSESLCPDMEYSTSETGNNKSSIEILFAFSVP